MEASDNPDISPSQYRMITIQGGINNDYKLDKNCVTYEL